MVDAIEIMLVVPCEKGRVDSEIYNLVAFGRRLQNMGIGAIGIWILGENAEGAAHHIAHATGVPVTAIHGKALSHYHNEAFCAVIAEEMETLHPTFVCAAHTSRGWEWVPALAGRTGAACVCGVDGLVELEGRICFQRERYGGKVKGLYASSAATTVITVQPGTFKFEAPSGKLTPGSVTLKKAEDRIFQTRYLGLKASETDTSDMTAAKIIVAVGNGIGEKENMALIHRLKQCLPKSEVAGTRIICDRGWLGYNRQVGVTGASVSPALYLACGISGASQHMMGMRGSKFVVAINRDSSAPVFNEADVCIVEDIVHFLPMLEEACLSLSNGTEKNIDDPKNLLGD